MKDIKSEVYTYRWRGYEMILVDYFRIVHPAKTTSQTVLYHSIIMAENYRGLDLGSYRVIVYNKEHDMLFAGF